MTPLSIDRTTEWLEADGLGGFASGTTAGINTRRYHALLLSAVNPPADRHVLVNDAVVWLETPAGTRVLSRHHYAPDVTTASEANLAEFRRDPWPSFRYEVDGIVVFREIIALHGLPLVLSRFRFERPLPGSKLCVRPLLSGRGFHALHHENPAFRFDATVKGELCTFHPYEPVPAVLSLANAEYVPAADWYRNFSYDEERARGLDHTEDLATPGILKFDLADPVADWIVAMDTPATRKMLEGVPAHRVAAEVRERELARRSRFSSALELSADAYIVKRGEGKTVIAGYPWFGDWGRDTFIALRGLCLATGRLAEACDILLAWSGAVSHGMLPNRFADRADEEPEYNSVDAALWYVLADGELLQIGGAVVSPSARAELVSAVERIIDGHVAGTRHGIRVGSDGLLAAGAPGVQLTWMDAKVGDRVITPRIGKPVEIASLWLNALAVAERLTGRWAALLRKGAENFEARFVIPGRDYLYDVVDVDHVAGAVDDSFRPNQLLAAGGLPFTVLSPARCRAVVDAVERELWTPLGPRSLARGHRDYVAHYEGGVLERDSSYHQGTVWPWLAGPFIEAWVKCRGSTRDAKREARQRFYEPLSRHLDAAGLGHVSEIADAESPHTPRGCPFQAWSVSELVRLERQVLADRPSVAEFAMGQGTWDGPALAAPT
jgi:predicted glycogen debranching enzyme